MKLRTTVLAALLSLTAPALFVPASAAGTKADVGGAEPEGLIPKVTIPKPVRAFVEDAPDGLKGIQVMDYVEEGRRIALKSGQTLVLSYLESCVHEKISGGTVSVGVSESRVDGGSVERHIVPCDGGRLLLDAQGGGKAGVTVYRGPVAEPEQAPMTLYATEPVLVVGKPGLVTFTRLDAPGDVISVVAPGRVDLATIGIRLTPGATYRVQYAGRAMDVRIDAGSAGSTGPALGRLIRF